MEVLVHDPVCACPSASINSAHANMCLLSCQWHRARYVPADVLGQGGVHLRGFLFTGDTVHLRDTRSKRVRLIYFDSVLFVDRQVMSQESFLVSQFYCDQCNLPTLFYLKAQGLAP